MTDGETDSDAGVATKTVFIRTYGCQMNVYDSERMAEALAADGYRQVDAPEGADLALLNTCHIREKAAEKVYSELGRLKALAEAKAADGGRMAIGVTGCVAQAEGAEIRRRQPRVDLVVGPQAYHRLPALVQAVQAGGVAAAIDMEFPAEDKFAALPPRRRASVASPSAFLTVQEGCDKFCAFCVVPYTRGAEFSRPVAQVLTEAKRLAERGVKELTLLGQNVNAYHGADSGGGEVGLASLIARLAELEGLERIRYTTSHPRDMDDALIEAHGRNPKLMPYLHLPVQSGSDRVLAEMNRKHTAAEYVRLIERIRAARPDIAISGDFIVGFPGETEAEFEETLALAREVDYAQAYSFRYSPRPGTPAAERAQTPEPVKEARLASLQDLLSRQQLRFNEGVVGRTVDVLLEKPGRRPGQLLGRSPHAQSVHVDAAPDRIGEVARVRIEGASRNSLRGVLASVSPLRAAAGDASGAHG